MLVLDGLCVIGGSWLVRNSRLAGLFNIAQFRFDMGMYPSKDLKALCPALAKNVFQFEILA
jgi:hypothetical protein